MLSRGRLNRKAHKFANLVICWLLRSTNGILCSKRKCRALSEMLFEETCLCWLQNWIFSTLQSNFGGQVWEEFRYISLWRKISFKHLRQDKLVFRFILSIGFLRRTRLLPPECLFHSKKKTIYKPISYYSFFHNLNVNLDLKSSWKTYGCGVSAFKELPVGAGSTNLAMGRGPPNNYNNNSSLQ